MKTLFALVIMSVCLLNPVQAEYSTYDMHLAGGSYADVVEECEQIAERLSGGQPDWCSASTPSISDFDGFQSDGIPKNTVNCRITCGE
ncbi:MAG: hypothetical protein A2284_14040 [Deltaproteobacteria bacterium RIFOXYA12_FULL_61_11]|nr:MAG: hypothetical protein A2284_14040 [Deltaproteobacteria bacterium RIFOXYA12_FULL_61_11]